MTERAPARSKARRGFQAFWLAAQSASGVVSLIALAGLVASSKITDEALRRVVENVAAVVFAVGLVHILSDAYLHARLSEEILERVDGIRDDILGVVRAEIDGVLQAIALKTNLGRAGVQSVERSAVDWEQFFLGAGKVVLLPADLRTWLNEEWHAILELGHGAALEVELLLPNPKSPNLADLGRRFNQDPTSLAAELDELALKVDDQWQTRNVRTGNLLVVKTYDRPCGFGVAIAEDRWAVSLPGINGPRGGERSVVALFREGVDPGFASWAQAQVDATDSVPFNRRYAP